MAFVLRFTREQGKPVERDLFAKVTYTKIRGLGRTKGWKLTEVPEDATQWVTKEAADGVAAQFTSEYYEFKVEEI